MPNKDENTNSIDQDYSYDQKVNQEVQDKMSRLLDEDRVSLFGETHFRGNSRKFGIKAKDRTRHTYVIGKTGMGKSTLLENLAIQDIQNGEGLCFIDPHGSSAEKLLSYVPEWRMKDVVYFNPSDMRYPIGLNVLEFVEEDVRHLVSSGLMNTFKKIFADQFSGRMVYLLQNAILSLLENKGESLLGINRIFIDKKYRDKIISNVKDPAVRSYWEDEFSKYTDKYIQEAAPAIQNKIGQFISNTLIRNIVGQEHTTFDIRQIMDQRKILICNLSLGLTGEENVDLIGSLLVTKIYLAALSRANLPYEDLIKAPPFYLYVDEFQNFVNESFAQILSQARKYNLGLIVAHQYIDQLDDVTRSAIFGNVGTMISFRVGATDAEALEKEFSPTFLAEDIVNLSRFEMITMLSIDGVSSAPFSALSMSNIKRENRDLSQAIIALSRATYGVSKDFVEEDIRAWYNNKLQVVNNNLTNNKQESIKTEGVKDINNTIVNNTESKSNIKYNDNLNKTKVSNVNNSVNNSQKYKDNKDSLAREKGEFRKQELQRIREKELQKVEETIDPVMNSLSRDKIDKESISHKDHKQETLSQTVLKAAGHQSDEYTDIVKDDNVKNFALRDALQKAMIVSSSSITTNTQTKNSITKTKVDGDFNEQETKKEQINQKDQSKEQVNKEQIDKEEGGKEEPNKEVESRRGINKESASKEEPNKTNTSKGDTNKVDIVEEEIDREYLEKLLKGE